MILAIGSPLMGKISARTGPRWPLTIGPMVVAIGLLLATRIAAGQAYWTDVFPAIAVISVGMALAVAPLTSAVLVSVDARHTGMVSGFNSALSRTGGLIATALLGAVLVAEGEALLRPFAAALIVAAIVAALGGVAAFIGLAEKRAP